METRLLFCLDTFIIHTNYYYLVKLGYICSFVACLHEALIHTLTASRFIFDYLQFGTGVIKGLYLGQPGPHQITERE